MSIQFPNIHTRTSVRDIWKEVFRDGEAFMDLFFSEKYRDENTLLAFVEERPVAALQMIPYHIAFYGQKIPFYYLVGLSTLPEYRGRGLMRGLILRAHDLMRDRQIPLSILVPAEETLFPFYEQFGYERTFEGGGPPFEPSLRQIWKDASGLEDAYRVFDRHFNKPDFCVLKSRDDFDTLIRLEILEGFPKKKNIWGASRVIEPAELLSLYAKANPHACFSLLLNDKQYGTSAFQVADGGVSLLPVTPGIQTDVVVDEKLFVRLLFGYKTNELQPPFNQLFTPQNPIMNYMLE